MTCHLHLAHHGLSLRPVDPQACFQSGAVIGAQVTCVGSGRNSKPEGTFCPSGEMPGLRSCQQGPRGRLALVLGHGWEAGLLGPLWPLPGTVSSAAVPCGSCPPPPPPPAYPFGHG